VIEAADADEAIAILVARLDIRILFTDIDMPGNMDGLRLAAAVRNRWPPVKILVTSGHHQVKAEQLPSEALFFRKPYNPEALVSALKHMAAA
jgi:CheY-like chemotaxis protein